MAARPNASYSRDKPARYELGIKAKTGAGNGLRKIRAAAISRTAGRNRPGIFNLLIHIMKKNQEKRYHVNLTSVPGMASFTKKPSKKLLAAVNAMAKLAYDFKPKNNTKP